MADEATVRNTLQILKQDSAGEVTLIDYQSRPGAFTVDVDGAKGPMPGAFTVTTAGTDCDLSQLSSPGLCRIMNQDADNYVEYGIYDPDTDFFYPLGELGPGESYILKLSRNILGEWVGTGTGTGVSNNTFRFKANTASCNVLVEAFER